ncbi:ABC transporter permease subunit [Alsobacter sp. SYSU M60028]|uniref:ABC transporter permease subunit n=1 Tax=Alsobacter ponti TaxID=2962936 RepID=A0ABT1LBT3_9HYPH|nr:ABC transporter permease subunit [Alsobacter ponti]MCP8938531.1 ABC transporter permease subunit [Alsobacter ponti]
MRSGAERRARAGRALVAGLPFAWLVAFFLAPFGLVAKISLSEKANARPPYRPAFAAGDGPGDVLDKLSALSLDNYRLLAEEPLYLDAVLTSLRLAATATVLALLIAYPVAYAMARAPGRLRPALLLLAMLPFWTSFLIRVYAWIGILKPEGLLNAALAWLGLIDTPLEILNTEWAVQIGLVYSYLPFMLLPLYAALERIDPTLLEAGQDLGAPPWKTFWLVTLPLSRPGVTAGCFLVFIPALGEFVIPDLLGGSETVMIGTVLWSEFFGNRDWPLASAVAVVLLVAVVAPMVLWRREEARRTEAPT